MLKTKRKMIVVLIGFFVAVLILIMFKIPSSASIKVEGDISAEYAYGVSGFYTSTLDSICTESDFNTGTHRSSWSTYGNTIAAGNTHYNESLPKTYFWHGCQWKLKSITISPILPKGVKKRTLIKRETLLFPIALGARKNVYDEKRNITPSSNVAEINVNCIRGERYHEDRMGKLNKNIPVHSMQCSINAEKCYSSSGSGYFIGINVTDITLLDKVVFNMDIKKEIYCYIYYDTKYCPSYTIPVDITKVQCPHENGL